MVISFPFGSERIMILLILIVLTVFLCIEMYYQPFLHQVNNNCDVVFQLLLMIIAYRFSRSGAEESESHRIWVVVDIIVFLPFVICIILISWDMLRNKNKTKDDQTFEIKKDKTWIDSISKWGIHSGRWIEKVIFGEEDQSRHRDFRYRYPAKEMGQD